MPSPKFSTIAAIFGIASLLFFPGGASAQKVAKSAAGERASPEQRAARAYDAARPNPLDLRAFLARMPKGADLHYHLSGGSYAESLIRVAAEEGLCVDLASHSFVKTVAMAQSEPPQHVCGDLKVAAAKEFADQHLYDALIDN